jgi:ribonuclease P protein component
VIPAGRHEGLGRHQRLQRRSSFLAAQQNGRRVSGRNLVVYAIPRLETPKAATRLGVTVSKKVGTSVVRNRVKRWIRESYRRMQQVAPAGLDLVVIARPTAAAASYEAASHELRALLARVAKP